MIYAHIPHYGYELCGGCSKWITTEPYYAIEVPDLDELVYIDGAHDNCLAEWGWAWPESGPQHIHYEDA